jgi:hypothetical protein
VFIGNIKEKIISVKREMCGFAFFLVYLFIFLGGG